MADIKISELQPTTDLEGLYTIGSDKNNLSKKVSLQFLREAADYAIEQGDYAKREGDAIESRITDFKAETDVKLTELESKLVTLKHIGSAFAEYDDWQIGDFFLNIATKKLCKVTNLPIQSGDDFTATIPIEGAIYTYDGIAYTWKNDTFVELSVLSIKHMGVSVGDFNDWVIGDLMYNSSTKLLYRIIKTPVTGGDCFIPFVPKSGWLYLYENTLYVWNGIDMKLAISIEIEENSNGTNTIVAGGHILGSCVSDKKLVTLKHIGSAFTEYDDWQIGDFFLNIATKKLCKVTNLPVQSGDDFTATIPIEGAIYTYDGIAYTWKNGELENINKCYYSNLMQVFRRYTTIGDSLMAGMTDVGGLQISSNDARELGNNWVGYIARRTGSEFKNLAVGGSNTHDWRFKENSADISLADIASDCYIIGLGTNDIWGQKAIGTPSDIKSEKDNNGDSFYGNYDWIVRQLKEYNPNAHIFCLTEPPSEKNVGVKEVNAAILHITELYPNVHCVDLSKKYEFVNSFVSGNLSNGHYNPIAYNYMSTIIEDEICKVIYANAELFKLAPYK